MYEFLLVIPDLITHVCPQEKNMCEYVQLIVFSEAYVLFCILYIFSGTSQPHLQHGNNYNIYWGEHIPIKKKNVMQWQATMHCHPN